LWPNFEVLYQHVSGGLRRTITDSSQDSCSLSLNPGPYEYQAGLPDTWL